MAIDVFKPRGKLKKNEPGAGVASVIQVPIICTVMSTVDPTHQGQIAVYPNERNDRLVRCRLLNYRHQRIRINYD